MIEFTGFILNYRLIWLSFSGIMLIAGILYFIQKNKNENLVADFKTVLVALLMVHFCIFAGLTIINIKMDYLFYIKTDKAIIELEELKKARDFCIDFEDTSGKFTDFSEDSQITTCPDIIKEYGEEKAKYEYKLDIWNKEK